MSHKRISFLSISLITLTVLFFAILYFLLSSLFLHVSSYSINAKVLSPIRIVHLSDLHNARFGKHNQILVSAISQQEPDLIVMSGDMLNQDEEDVEIVTSLIRDLSRIAPVYFGYGNHEKAWEKRFARDLRPIIRSAGAIVVDNDYIDLDFRGTALRIGGYMGFYPVPAMTTSDIEQQEFELAFIKEFENTDRLKLLIDHIPTGWIDWHYADINDVDVVFSGHYHGGVIRIPILEQGLYAPYVGWFPPFSKGIFVGSKAVCVLSAGLGNEHHIPRFNDPPEIVIVDFLPYPDHIAP